MLKTIRILHLEDVEEDSVLVDRELSKGQFPFEKKWVIDRSGFINAIIAFQPDIILADHSLPHFDSLAALELVQQMDCNVPFVLVTSSLSEEFAVDIIKRGATDYILKERMQRLPAAVLNALEKRDLAKERESYFNDLLAKTALLNEAERITGSGSWEWTPDFSTMHWSDGMFRLLNYAINTVQPSFEAIFRRVDPKHRETIRQNWNKAVAASEPFSEEFCLLNEDGLCEWFLGNWKPLKRDNLVLKWVGTLTNINNQKITSLHQEQLTNELEKQVQQRTQELSAANEKLALSNDNLQQFAYVASHDLQEPLRKIKTFIGVLKLNLEPGNEQALLYASKVEHAAARMRALITNLLDFSLVSEASEDQLEPTDMNTIISGVLTDLELVISQKGALIEVGILPTIAAIPVQMHQLLYNLLGNALKYTGENVVPQVSITNQILDTATQAAKGLPLQYSYNLLTVTDNGIGFAQEYTETIFEIFKRLHSKTKYVGTGIGLALCRKIVERLGGRIWARSVPGQGTSFFVALPVLPSKA